MRETGLPVRWEQKEEEGQALGQANEECECV